MKLLEVAEFYSKCGGGVRTFVERKFEFAHICGLSLVVVAPGAENRVEERRGGRLIWVKTPPIPVDPRYHLFFDSRPVDEIVAAERPDFIEGASPWRGAWIAARQPASIPKALFIHQDPVLTYPRTILRTLAAPETIDRQFAWFHRYFGRLQNRFDTSVVASRWLADRFEKAGMVRPEIIGMGVDPSHFSPKRRSDRVRSEMLASCGVSDPHATLFVTVSRHHPEKRLPMLIEAIKRAEAEQNRPIALYIIGDGPDRSRSERLARAAGGVFVAGFISDRARVADLLASADTYVHGCPSETYGLVIAEALASGLPQVVPDQGGAGEIPSPASAEFYRSDDVQACASAIGRVLMRERAAMAQGAVHDAVRIRDNGRSLHELDCAL
ncbi:MAG: glycosyltransferase [Parvularculaceae bacterium]